MKRRIAEGEDASVGSDEPVAASRASRGDADDRLVQVHGAGRPVEAGVAGGEDAAVGRDAPRALAAGSGGHADDRRVERHAARSTPELIGVPATALQAGTIVAATAIARIATLMRGIQLGAVPRCRTMRSPSPVLRSSVSDHQRIGTDQQGVEGKAGPGTTCRSQPGLCALMPGDEAYGRASCSPVAGGRVVVGFGCDVVGAPVVVGFGTRRRGGGRCRRAPDSGASCNATCSARAVRVAGLVDDAVECDVESVVTGRDPYDLDRGQRRADVVRVDGLRTPGRRTTLSVTGTGFEIVRFSSRTVRPSLFP